MDLKPKITSIPEKNTVEVEKAIRAYLPVEQIEDPNDSTKMIDEYTFEEWLSILADRYFQKLYDRGRDKLAMESSRKIDIFK